MKALIVADLRDSLRQFDWLLGAAPDYDLVIIAGDLLDIAGHCDLDVQIVVVTKYLARISRQTRLVTCSGNHDGDTKNEADEFIAEWLQDVREERVHLDGESVDVATALLTICSWWDGPVTREAVERLLSSVAPQAPGAWIWVYHGPPDRAAVSWTGRQYQGRQVSKHVSPAAKVTVGNDASCISSPSMGLSGGAPGAAGIRLWPLWPWLTRGAFA